MNPSANLTKNRKDLSPYLFHFTKGADAYDRLVNILKQLKPFRNETHFLVAPQQRKAKQHKILIFNENRDFLFSLKTTMIVQTSGTSRFLECYATSVTYSDGYGFNFNDCGRLEIAPTRT